MNLCGKRSRSQTDPKMRPLWRNYFMIVSNTNCIQALSVLAAILFIVSTANFSRAETEADRICNMISRGNCFETKCIQHINQPNRYQECWSQCDAEFFRAKQECYLGYPASPHAKESARFYQCFNLAKIREAGCYGRAHQATPQEEEESCRERVSCM